MLDLDLNCTIRIDDGDLNGVFRVVANDGSFSYVVLVKIKDMDVPGNRSDLKSFLHFVDRESIEHLQEIGKIQRVTIQKSRKSLWAATGTKLSKSEEKTFVRRKEVMALFLDHQRLSEKIYLQGGIGQLVRQTVAIHKVSRMFVYRQWGLLCNFGFEAESLLPGFSRCGAPGEFRPVTEERKKAGRKSASDRFGSKIESPQMGVTGKWRAKILTGYNRIPNPKPPFKDVYQQIIKNFFVEYQVTEGGVKGVLPPAGQYPNRGQILHVIKSISKLDLAINKTTRAHFVRSKRGLTGRSWEGVAGPGHTFAIDSTIGDIYLRSSINRAWIIGRPIVYIVVDVWSTAVVGFYVSLRGPSWEEAKIAIFSTLANPELLASQWGWNQNHRLILPTPAAPFTFLCDRGEYLSAGARETGMSLGLNFQYAAARRADMKGCVEVLNRITKDEQYIFIPGAMNARRDEYELRASPDESAFTLREYCQYLAQCFKLFNSEADRQNRLDAIMMAENVNPTPLGIWQFGVDAGIAHGKAIATDKLIATLLPKREVVVRRDGIWFGGNQYTCDLAKSGQWTTIARHYGANKIPAYLFPGNLNQLWMAHPSDDGLLKLDLTEESRAPTNTSYDEFLDAKVFEISKGKNRRHQSLEVCLQYLRSMEQLVKDAKKKTKTAEESHKGKKPSFRDARHLESLIPDEDVQLHPKSQVDREAETKGSFAIERNEEYIKLMNQIGRGFEL